MIYLPPNPSIIINRISSTLQFKLKKNKAMHSFVFNVKEFWSSFWVLLLLNAFQNVLSILAVQKVLKFQGEYLITKIIIITVVQLALYSIAINRFLIIKNKEELFLKFLIPFHWIQSTQILLSFVLAILGVFFPGVVILFFKFNLIIWLIFSVWRLCKHELSFSNLETISYICVYYLIYLGVLIIFLGFISPLK